MDRSIVSKRDISAQTSLATKITLPENVPADAIELADMAPIYGDFAEPDHRHLMVEHGLHVNTPASPPPITSPQADDYSSRLMKYIPAEVIALYLTLDALIRSSNDLPQAIYWIVFVFGLCTTYLYLKRVANVTKQVQLLVSVGAFAVWAFTLGGPFAQLDWYNPIYGSLLLPSYTLLVPIIDP